MLLLGRLAREDYVDIDAGVIKPGVATEEIDHVVHLACIARNCYPSPLNYYNFPKSCCTSVNKVVCHGIPDRWPLQEGDIVNVDITLYHNVYHGDLNEMFFVGDVDEQAWKLVQTTCECLMQATDAAGHIFTIEPIICEGGRQDEAWMDGWTAVMRDGKLSAQSEHNLLVTDTSCEILTP
uniref:Peptidase M24 domain-containing protein n=1 Tax=Monodon monoceros TaxID=40151 RepID=A0A8C6AY90_MONMO